VSERVSQLGLDQAHLDKPRNALGCSHFSGRNGGSPVMIWD
jgi:hypothetical protein